MVNMGLWQLRRLDDKRERNDLIEARLDEAPIPIEDVDDLDDARFVQVTVTGEYVANDVKVFNRTFEGFAGEWPVGLVELAGGDHVVVSRGFAAVDEAIAAPADGQVTVTGFVIPRAR